MKKFFFYPLRGFINLTLLLILTLLTTIAIYLAAPFVLIIPHKKYRHVATRCIQRIPIYWIGSVKLLLNITLRKKIDVQGPDNLQKHKPYLLVSNHSSGIDILILSYAFHNKAPSLRFFMKKELLWTLPFAGLAAWILGYPFMERHTSSQIRKNPALKNKDVATTRKACSKFALYPATIMNYLEGTRFTERKKALQNSPYQYLLKPKAGGIAIVLNEMRDHLAGFIDATIAYQPPSLSFWRFCCGNFTKISCHYDVLPIQAHMLGNYLEDRHYRINFQNWLNARWQEKDKKLTEIFTTHD